MSKNVLSLKEIKDYLTAFKQVYNEIDKKNQKLSVNIAHPRLNPRIAEDLCYQKHKKILPESIEAKKVSSTHPDLQVKTPDGNLNVEVKSTTADFQDIEADQGCDMLLWVNLKNYVKSDEKIKIYILDNTDRKLEQHVEGKKEDYKRPTRMTLNEFIEISTRKRILDIDEEKSVVTEEMPEGKKIVKEEKETKNERPNRIPTKEEFEEGPEEEGELGEERDFWVLNTEPSHWDICKRGPVKRDVHGDNVGHPWHGLPENSRPSSPHGLKKGDIFLVRQTSASGAEYGVKGVWFYHQSKRVESQDNVPQAWREHEEKLRDYRWFIYCRSSTRELSSIYNENWKKLGIHHARLTGTMVKLEEKEKRNYIQELLNHEGLEEKTRKLFQDQI